MTPDPAARRAEAWLLLPLALALLCLLAWARPLNHDESQYVAAARLVADGLLPYRDFAYLQTPLQPFVFAPVAALAGEWAWPALRLVNAALGAAALAGVVAAARSAGASARAALMGGCDVFLFSVGTARNDALPAALFAAALIPVARVGSGKAGRRGAALAGALLAAAAAAAKVSYAISAAAYGLYALVDRRHRPVWVAAGAAPVALAVLASAAVAPNGFWFGVVELPARGPADYYAATGRAWRLGVDAKLIDTLKFLALGPALLAVAVAFRARRTGALDVLLLAAVVASLLPAPTWRQYLLPMLPVLFVRLALAWRERPPGARLRAAFALFAVAGVAPTLASLVQHEPALPSASGTCD